MVRLLINISGNTNRILSTIKVQFRLKDRSAAINKLAEEYGELVSERKVKASYLKKLKAIEKEPIIKIGTLKDFEKRYGLK